MKKIIASNGNVILVDDDVFGEYGHLTFQITKDGLARHYYRDETGKTRTVYLSHLVYGPRKPKHVLRFKNGDRLDCRRENLIEVPYSLHLRWAKKERQNKTGYIGVTYIPDSCCENHCWRATTRIDGVVTLLGLFPTAKEAATCYDNFVKHKFGPRARINFPSDSC